jgi:RNA polymerase sigma factor (sigma-70 family)
MLESKEFLSLIEKIRSRDDGAMCILVKVYSRAMEQTAAKLIGPALQSQLDPADVVQHVQVTLWVGIRSGRYTLPTPGHFLALANSLVRRRIARQWRKIKLEMSSTVDGRLIDTHPDSDFSDYFSAPASEQRLEVDEVLERFLSQVDEVDQQLIRMRFRGLTTAEAARALDLDPGFLRVRLGRLRQRFTNLWPQLEVVS